MLMIYRKQLQKTWLFWIIPITLLVGLALLVVFIWPDYAPILAQFEGVMADNPLLASILGESTIGSFEGFVGIELFIVGDFVFVILILLFGTMVIAREAETGTLDIILSYPVPRWKFLLEKLFAIITLSVTFPILIWGTVTIGASVLNALDPNLNLEFNNEAFFIALLGKWIVYMVFTCITIFCSVIFMDTIRTLSLSGLIVGGSWILERFGGLIRTANEDIADIMQGVSLFHYLDGATVMNAIMNNESFPLDELVLVLIIGIIALLASLFLFR
ncbi:MAG: ABC transporter permease, partial [Candidatus Thorarchaeota archaeon]